MQYLHKGYLVKLVNYSVVVTILVVMCVYVLQAVLEFVQIKEYYYRAQQNDIKSTDLKVHSFGDTNFTRFEVSKVKLQFLTGFKSPCFLERIPDNKLSSWSVYDNNAYVTHTEDQYTKRSLFGGKIEKYPWKHGIEIAEFNHDYNSDSNSNHSTGLNCRIRCLPYFFLLGMAKSGTSDFYTRIKHHPLVYPGTNKELFYWTQYRFQINATIGDYADLFDKSLSTFITEPTSSTDHESGKVQKYYPYTLGDFTSVTFTDDVWWREHPGNQGLAEPKYLKIHDLYSVLPNAKLVVILRNPSTRLYSSYNMFRKGSTGSPEDFHQRVVMSIEWWHNCTVVKGLPRRACAYGSPPEMPPVVCVLKDRSQNNRWYGEINVGNYSGEIRRGMYPIYVKDWLSVFPKEQLLLLKTEEYSTDPSHIFDNTVLPFLDLPKVEEADVIASNAHKNARSYEPMRPETRQILDDFYAPFNVELAEYLNDDKWLWND